MYFNHLTNCETNFCKCYKTLEYDKNKTLAEPVPHDPKLDRCIEAKNVAKLVESWSKKQAG